MPLERIRIADTVSAPPERVYAAWLDGKLHSEMTGSPATGEAVIGAPFTAGDGYISGRNLDLQPYSKRLEAPKARIVQSWRTTSFHEDDIDSRLEVVLEPHEDGTRITIIHTDLPLGSGYQYEDGWVENYFAPMQKYFSG